MDIDLEGIIQCIKQGDETGVQTQLQEFNKEVTPHRSLHIFVFWFKNTHGPLCAPSFNHCVSPVCPVLLLWCGGEGAKESEFMLLLLSDLVLAVFPWTFSYPASRPYFSFSATPPHLLHSLSVISKSAVSVVPDPQIEHRQSDWLNRQVACNQINTFIYVICSPEVTHLGLYSQTSWDQKKLPSSL